MKVDFTVHFLLNSVLLSIAGIHLSLTTFVKYELVSDRMRGAHQTLLSMASLPERDLWTCHFWKTRPTYNRWSGSSWPSFFSGVTKSFLLSTGNIYILSSNLTDRHSPLAHKMDKAPWSGMHVNPELWRKGNEWPIGDMRWHLPPGRLTMKYQEPPWKESQSSLVCSCGNLDGQSYPIACPFIWKNYIFIQHSSFNLSICLPGIDPLITDHC